MWNLSQTLREPVTEIARIQFSFSMQNVRRQMLMITTGSRKGRSLGHRAGENPQQRIHARWTGTAYAEELWNNPHSPLAADEACSSRHPPTLGYWEPVADMGHTLQPAEQSRKEDRAVLHA